MTKRYSTQFKQEALHFVQNHPSLAVHTVAKQLGVGYSTLDHWIRLHRNSIQCRCLSDEHRTTTHPRT